MRAQTDIAHLLRAAARLGRSNGAQHFFTGRSG
jgi:hypothetical protein